jgi:hypothetical protein
VALLTLGACKIERTPVRYVDHPSPTERQRADAESELQDRLLSLGPALSGGRVTEALIALSPADDAYVLGPDQGETVTGAGQIESLLASLGSRSLDVEIRDVEVTVGPIANAAWFRAAVDVPGHTRAGSGLRVTGVFIRHEGAWHLVQAHVSAPLSVRDSLRSSSPPSGADSAEGG